VLECGIEFVNSLWPERIPALGAVERDTRYATLGYFVICDIPELHL
jgi:hypothetical protein